MPTSKKQLVKLNQVKKAKAEELSKQAAAGSQDAKKKLEEAREKAQVSCLKSVSLIFFWFPRLLPGLLAEASLNEITFTRYEAPHTKIGVPLFLRNSGRSAQILLLL